MARLLDEHDGLSAEAAALELGCTRRTVYRDFEILQEIGVPLYAETDGKRTRWRLVAGPKRRLAVTLTFSEMLALTAGRDLLAGLSGTFFHEAAITALEKIRAALPEPLLARADASAEVLMADAPTTRYRGRGGAVQTIAAAIETRETNPDENFPDEEGTETPTALVSLRDAGASRRELPRRRGD